MPRGGKFSALAIADPAVLRGSIPSKTLTPCFVFSRDRVAAPLRVAYGARSAQAQASKRRERTTMEPKAAALPALDHEAFLRRAFDVARRSRQQGDHPFGSILVGPDGAVLKEQGNGFSSEGGDMTAHAERLLATWSSKTLGSAFLARCTLYTSAEPCAMCSGAIYWAGIGRVVYGQSEKSLKAMTGAHGENPTLDLPCRVVFGAGQRAVEIVGPLLEGEAAALQRDFWDEKAQL
jgi:tRNA(Arg) A34 adenosine deaminase TadA